MSARSLRRALGLAAVGLTLPALTLQAVHGPAAQAAAPSARAADPGAPVTLSAPHKVTAYTYGGRTYSDLGLRLIANDAPFEVRGVRAGYDQRIAYTWRSGAGPDVALPKIAGKTFDGLARFLTIKARPVGGGKNVTLHRQVCLNGYAERVRPDAPPTSPYPDGCFYNPYSLGSVQGVQAGWATPLLSYRPLPLAKGKYDVTVTVRKGYAKALGLSADRAQRTLRLRVKKAGNGGGDFRTGATSGGNLARPAAHRPAGVSGGRVAGPQPDLRSLPAWGIEVSPNGRFLRFSATVWNAGDSPLVVDGFREEGTDEMTAYQYFFDGDGQQTGYQQVGHMHWDAKPTHQHWHFKDFASYTLLRADRTKVVKSKKEAFCLANTDAVDLTVPDAAWRPENTDLETACGEHESLSIREVLASGWGDTYAQFRAGQSFNLEGLPNGTYYIEVKGNPKNHLVESSTANNVSLRRIRLGGKPGARTVEVPRVGIIDESQGPRY